MFAFATVYIFFLLHFFVCLFKNMCITIIYEHAYFSCRGGGRVFALIWNECTLPFFSDDN